MKSSHRAFTLIELCVSILIVAILSVALVVNFGGASRKANFDDQVVQIVHLLEQARSYSLTNFLINDTEPVDYYLLTITSAGLSLDAYGPTLDSALESVALDSNFSITVMTGYEYVFYFPPNGDICFATPDCDSSLTEISFILVDDTGTYSQVISMNKYGGFPELE